MKKKMYYILLIINLLSIIICFTALKNISNEIILLPLCIIFLSELFFIFKRSYIFEISMNKKYILIATFLSILFLLMLPINYCFYKLDTICINNFFNIIIKTIFCVSLFLTLFYLILSIFSYECKETNNLKQTKKIIMLITILIGLIFICSTTTGFYDWDFPHIWQSGNDGKWSNGHTFAFAFVIYFCKILFNNPYILIIINFVLYIYFCNYALKIIEHETKNKNIMKLFLIINIFTMVGFDQLRYVLKDVIFSLSFGILILTIIEYLISKKFSKKIMIHLIIFSINMVLFRHGSLYLLIFIYLVFSIFILLKKQYFNLIYIFIIVVSFIFSNSLVDYIGFKILHGENYVLNYKYNVPIYQIGSFAHDGYKFTDDQIAYLEEYLPMEYMIQNFEKYNVDKLTKEWYLLDYYKNAQNFNYDKIIGINLDMFIKQPKFYIKSILDLTNILWKMEIDDRNNWPKEYTEYLYKFDWNKEPRYINSTIMYKSTFLDKFIDTFIIDFYLKGFLFNFRVRGAFPLFMLILSAFLFIIKKNYKYLIPTSFILCLYILLFLSLPASIARYCLPFITIYPVIFCLALGKNKTTE